MLQMGDKGYIGTSMQMPGIIFFQVCSNIAGERVPKNTARRGCVPYKDICSVSLPNKLKKITILTHEDKEYNK